LLLGALIPIAGCGSTDVAAANDAVGRDAATPAPFTRFSCGSPIAAPDGTFHVCVYTYPAGEEETMEAIGRNLNAGGFGETDSDDGYSTVYWSAMTGTTVHVTASAGPSAPTPLEPGLAAGESSVLLGIMTRPDPSGRANVEEPAAPARSATRPAMTRMLVPLLVGALVPVAGCGSSDVAGSDDAAARDAATPAPFERFSCGGAIPGLEGTFHVCYYTYPAGAGATTEALGRNLSAGGFGQVDAANGYSDLYWSAITGRTVDATVTEGPRAPGQFEPGVPPGESVVVLRIMTSSRSAG